MEVGVVGGIGGLMAQEVAVGAGIAQAAEAVASPFAQREGDGAVGIPALDLLYQLAQHFVREPGVLAALQHEGAEPQPVADLAALQYLLRRQPVALRQGRTSDAAVEAVVATMVAYLDESAHEDIASVNLVAHTRGLPEELLYGHRVAGGQQVADAI